jgi:hypothetical protein
MARWAAKVRRDDSSEEAIAAPRLRNASRMLARSNVGADGVVGARPSRRPASAQPRGTRPEATTLGLEVTVTNDSVHGSARRAPRRGSMRPGHVPTRRWTPRTRTTARSVKRAESSAAEFRIGPTPQGATAGAAAQPGSNGGERLRRRSDAATARRVRMTRRDGVPMRRRMPRGRTSS